MDRKRMELFLKNIRNQKRKEYCKNGHFYEGDAVNSCVNCGTPIEKLLNKGEF